MIVYPKNWQNKGQAVTVQDVENTIEGVLEGIACRNLALSGGLDSSLLLYYLCQLHYKIEVFTMGESDEHPDIIFAKKIVEYYEKSFDVDIRHHVYYSRETAVPIYKLFYKFVSEYTHSIIAGDGVDEFMCGYYAHMEDPSDASYYKHLRQLQNNHLIPLNLESGEVEVYLPYLDEKLIRLLSQIPLEEKVDEENRKKFMVEVARGKVPDFIIERRKYGFCDALIFKEERTFQ